MRPQGRATGGIVSYDEAIFQMYLGEVPMFQACSEEELNAVAYLASPMSLAAGTEIVREGDTGDDFYVLMMGTATVRRQEHDVGNLEPGDFFGELALFDPAPRNATITADVPVTMAVLERGRFQTALDAIPALRDALLKGMARRLHDVDARV
jgi:CRP/FNR family transcriptional regulator, cyclic AMP receptor protein